jgi:hypothetical protein
MRVQRQVEYSIKLAEFQHVLAYQELVFLKDFDQREQVCLLVCRYDETALISLLLLD